MTFRLSLKLLMIPCFLLIYKIGAARQIETRNNDQQEKAVYDLIKRVLPDHAVYFMVSFQPKKWGA